MSTFDNRLFQTIKQLASDKKISNEAVKTALEDAIIKASTKTYDEEVFDAKVDMDKQTIEYSKVFDVVADDKEEINSYSELTVEEAKKYKPNPIVGDKVYEALDLSTSEMSLVKRLVQIFKQNIAHETNQEIIKDWQPKVGQIFTFEVEKNEPKIRGCIINLDDEDTLGFMANSDGVRGEELVAGKKYKFIIKEVKETTKGWPVILSRGSEEFVAKLLAINIPEIEEGVIEIVNIARVSGFKTKVVLSSKVSSIDSVGTCIGKNGDRIRPILEEINSGGGNERIEFVKHTPNFVKLAYNAALPAVIYGIRVDEETDEEGNFKRSVKIVVDKNQKALVIGTRGQNVRLLSRLLQATVDVLTISEAHDEGIQYEKIDLDKIKKEEYENTFSKYKESSDLVDKVDLFRFDQGHHISKPTFKKTSNPIVEEVFEEVEEEVADIKPVDSIDISSFDDDILAQIEEFNIDTDFKNKK